LFEPHVEHACPTRLPCEGANSERMAGRRDVECVLLPADQGERWIVAGYAADSVDVAAAGRGALRGRYAVRGLCVH